ncbi:MAG: hypothetical protein D3914_08150 [Candidatus Electrothrix sp. LOE2]|nr:hypothetical protein [Candidatus Electrothrix sp. LOE2]
MNVKLKNNAVHDLVETHDGITWGVELSTGLDRLKYGLHVQFPKDQKFFDALGESKRHAQDLHTSVPLTLEGFDQDAWTMHTTGRSGGFTFHISRADVHLFVSVRKNWMQTPNIWVDIGSVSCWNPGYGETLAMVEELVSQYGGKIHKNGISEVHLCADCIGLELSELGIQSPDLWITRANKFHFFYDRREFSGISLNQSEGRLGISNKENIDTVGSLHESGLSAGEGDISFRVYNKVLELKRDGAKQSVFASVWGKTEYDNQPVTRVEFQLRRPVLRQLKVNTLEELFEKLGGIWAYCVGDWAVFCNTAPDRENRHQDRADVHPWWIVMQSIDWNTYHSVAREKILPQKDKYQLADQMVGCALNLAAIERCPLDIDSIVDHLQIEVEQWCRRKIQELDKDGKPVLLEKMKKKLNECWPHGIENEEFHGPYIETE